MTQKNILFIMCDQLRYDYLGCTGHPTLKTPNIDALAARGVTFSNTYYRSAGRRVPAFTQASICLRMVRVRTSRLSGLVKVASAIT